MIALLATAGAADLAWTCAPPDTAEALEPFRDRLDGDVATACATAVAAAEAWLDDACVTSCETGADVLACEEAACLTDAGAWVEYRREVRDTTGSSYRNSGSETTTTFHVEAPAGDALGTLDLTTVSGSWSEGEASGGDTRCDVAWTGELDASWPVDETLIATSSAWVGLSGPASEASWSAPACTWSAAYASGDLYASWRVAAGDAATLVQWGGASCDDAFLDAYWEHGDDGAIVGAVDPDTWARLPDADGDTWPDRLDCAPDDAAVHPCAVDDTVDGIDQDCDGDDADHSGRWTLEVSDGAAPDSGVADTGEPRARPDAPDDPRRGCGGHAGLLVLVVGASRRHSRAGCNVPPGQAR